MTSTNFIKKFFEKFEENREEIQDEWFELGLHTNNMTELIKKIGNGVYEVVENGFWTLDYIFFKERIISEGIYPQRLDVIVEHENDRYKSYEEMIKLCYWKANLKVLITYCSPIAKIITSDYLKDKWKDIIEKTNSENDNFVLIIGIDSEENPKIFKAYEWINEKKEFKLYEIN